MIEINMADLQRSQFAENLKNGVALEDPAGIIPWRTSPRKLAKMYPGLKKITRGYYSLDVNFLNGLHCTMALNFRPSNCSGIRFDIFRPAEYCKNHTLKESYGGFQKHIELALGKPSSTTHDPESGFDSHVWKIGMVIVEHYVFERFGLEEHFYICGTPLDL